MEYYVIHSDRYGNIVIEVWDTLEEATHRAETLSGLDEMASVHLLKGDLKWADGSAFRGGEFV